MVFDELLGAYTITSAAFSPSRDGFLSVDLEQVLSHKGKSLTGNYPHLPRAVALVAHAIEAIVEQGMTVHHQPLPENYYHGGIGSVKAKHRRWLKENMEMIVPLDQEAAKGYDNSIS